MSAAAQRQTVEIEGIASLVKVMSIYQADQEKIGDCNSGKGSVLAYRQIEIASSEDGRIRTAGYSQDGTQWEANIHISPVASCEAWSADLVPGHPRSILILASGINSSGGWDSTLSVLLFDKAGKPMPWVATSHFESNQRGILQVVKFADEDTPLIIVPARHGDRFSGFEYTYDLYKPIGDRIERIVGEKGNLRWPSRSSPESSDTEARYQNGSLSTNESDTNALRQTVLDVKEISLDSVDGNMKLQTADKDSVSLPEILVIDSEKLGRKIYFSPVERDFKRIIGAKAGVRLIGNVCDAESCQAMIGTAVVP